MENKTWQYTTLGEETEILTGFPFKSSKYTNEQRDIPLLRGDNVAQGQLRWDNIKQWPLSETATLDNYFLDIDDVVIAMDRPWIEAGLKYASISVYDLPCLLVQRVARLRAKHNLSQKFLKYIIGSTDFTNHVLGIQTGTAIPHISGSQIKEFRFLCPPLSEQRAIAHILGSLDDKIELNRQMNDTLESMARALFKSWFVDFDPVHAKMEGRQPYGMDAETAGLFPDGYEDSELGEIPRGWHVAKIGDAVRVVGGSTPSTKEVTYWEDGIIHWATPKDLAPLSNAVLLNTERCITESGLQQISSGLLPIGTVLLSSRAPIGYLAVTEIPVAINQGFIALICERELTNHYVLQWLRLNMDAIKSRANGTTFLEISKANFRPIPVVIPPEAILARFNSQAKAIHQGIVNNLRQSDTLTAIRDALLPKLLSGQIRVRDAEKLVESAV